MSLFLGLKKIRINPPNRLYTGQIIFVLLYSNMDKL